MIKIKPTYCLLIMIIVASPFCSDAQKNRTKSDSLSSIREFVEVSNLYKQLPLVLNMEVKRTANIVVSEEDTSVTQAQFFLAKNGSYVRFGKMEQLVNDSLVLVVSDEMEKMFLSPNPQSIEERIRLFTGIQFQDSSIEAMVKKYKAEAFSFGDTSSIILNSRNFLYNTSWPKEAIELQFDSKTKLLYKATTLKRSLLPIEDEVFKTLSAGADTKNLVLTINDKPFVVREEQISFIYKEIKHELSKLPATISERIRKTADGDYLPVKNYEAYTVTIN